MKKTTILILIILTTKIYSQTLCESMKVVPVQTFNQCNNNQWVLVFEDNFNGSSLDLSKWTTNGSRNRYCNDEQQYYTSGDNIEVNNGILKLIAKKETVYAKADDSLPDNEQLYCDGDDRGQNKRYFYYTSANIETIKKFSYGKYEARIKIPKGKGFWPAFWMYGGDPVYNEIDVFEFWNQDILGIYDPSQLSKVHNMTIHFDYDGNGKKSMCHTKYTGVDFSQDFHIFTVNWEKDKIEWYVDGTLKRTDYNYYTIQGQATGCTINALQYYLLNTIYTRDPMNIILNFAIQSGSNSPETTTTFPSQMEVDWVRYYQRNPCQDVNITDASQYTLNNQLYNVLVGEDVSINCNFSIQSDQQLDILAKNIITLGTGFNAELGSTFSAKIEPTVCDYTLKSSSASNIQDTVLTEVNTQTKEELVENLNIQIFPNPNDGRFILDLGSNEFANFNITIANIYGKLIYSLDQLNSSLATINLKGKPSGVYILYLYNKLDENLITHKIIIQ